MEIIIKGKRREGKTTIAALLFNLFKGNNNVAVHDSCEESDIYIGDVSIPEKIKNKNIIITTIDEDQPNIPDSSTNFKKWFDTFMDEPRKTNAFAYREKDQEEFQFAQKIKDTIIYKKIECGNIKKCEEGFYIESLELENGKKLIADNNKILILEEL